MTKWLVLDRNTSRYNIDWLLAVFFLLDCCNYIAELQSSVLRGAVRTNRKPY